MYMYMYIYIYTRGVYMCLYCLVVIIPMLLVYMNMNVYASIYMYTYMCIYTMGVYMYVCCLAVVALLLQSCSCTCK